jgi:hypothetical protein
LRHSFFFEQAHESALQRRLGASDAAVDQACHHSHPFVVRLLLLDISIDLSAKTILHFADTILHPRSTSTRTAAVKDERVTYSPSYPGTPRWVKVFVMVAFIAVVLFGILHLGGGGIGHVIDRGMSGHGPLASPPEGAAHQQGASR